MRLAPLRDELRNIVRGYGMNTDIEDRKRDRIIRQQEATLILMREPFESLQGGPSPDHGDRGRDARG